MARFSAVISDDSDSDDGSSSRSVEKVVSHPSPIPEEEHDGTDEEDSDSGSASSSSSDSEMQEDELLASPPRKKDLHSAATSDEDDGEEDEGDEDEDEDEPLPSSKPPPHIRSDPTIIPWAHHVGVDAQKMHVMQTSLFRMPEEAAAMKALDQRIRPSDLLAKTLNRKHSRESDGDGIRFESRERASFAHDIEPLPYRQTRKYARVESSASAVSGNEGALVDSGLALGRSFRATWGPMGVLAHLGELCSPSSTIRTSANSSIVKITRVPSFSQPDAVASGYMSKLLQHHLTHSPIEPDEAGVPFANPSSDLRFSSFSSLFSLSDRSFEATLFRLGHALFDEMDLCLADTITIDIRRRIETLRRKAALSAWIEETVAPTIEGELRERPTASSAAIAYTLLTGNQVERACERAMDGGNVKLATLISQASGDPEFMEDLRDQLRIWREQRIDVHIDESVRKTYALLAGIVDVVEGSKGTGTERCPDIDLVSGLDWKRTFGLHLWFSEPQDASIAQVYQAYIRHWKESPNRVTPPHPPYIDEVLSTSTSTRWRFPTSNVPHDALLSLIRLHAEPACSLSQILIPASFGPSPIDCALPWHLYILLSRCMRVRDLADRGDPGIDGNRENNGEEGGDVRIEGHSPSADLLASSYAFQLEQLGMIQEAVFVLLHIEGFAGREKAIKDLLSRSAGRLDEWTTRGLIGSLKIPIAWVNEAKAIHAFSRGSVWEAYQLYMEAELFNSAHELAVLELAPDAVIRRDMVLLNELFAKMIGCPIDGWHVRGKAFLDYAHIMTRASELREQMDDAALEPSDAAELHELVRQIPRLISTLSDVLSNRADPRHNASLTIMIGGLMQHLDRVQPLSLSQSKVQLSLVDDATKLRHLRSVAQDRFRQAIEVA